MKYSRWAQPRVAAVSVFVMVMIAAAIPFGVTRHLADRQDMQVLTERADKIKANISTVLALQRTSLRAVGVTLNNGGGKAGFEESAGEILGTEGFTYIAVYDTTSNPPRAIESVGTATPDSAAEVPAVINSLTIAQPFATTGVFKDANGSYVGLAYGPPIAPANQSIYAEIKLDTFDKLSTRALFGAATDIDNALYSGGIAPENLVFATTRDLPLTDRQVVTPVDVGSAKWTLVTEENAPVGDSLARALPWIILIAGFLIALLTATSVNVSLRRRDSAVAIMEERAQENLNILDAAKEAFIAMDRGGIITRWSGQAEALFGWSAHEAVGRRGIDTLIPSEERAAYQQRAASFFAENQEFDQNQRVELVALRKDGSEIPIEVSVWITRSSGRETFNAIAHDITERKRAAEELAAVTKRALEVSQLKSEFLANMSHEIRTPMNGVIGMTTLLLASELTEGQREQVVTLRNSAESLLTIINDILDFSKIEAGKLDIDNSTFNVRTVINGTTSMVASTAHDKGLELTTTVADTVPEWVIGDPGRLRQVLLNIIGNAVKFTETGSVKLTCDGEKTSDGYQLYFKIIDTGIGIPPEARAKLFDSFVQVDMSNARKHEGTGLGLAISSQLVALMNGEIGVRSEPGNGSTFWFSISVGRASVSPSSEYRPSPSRIFKTFEPNVLIVEDNIVNQRVAALTLEMLGCKTSIADNGNSAVEQIKEQDFDIIFMDCQMPGMDGYEATRQIRAAETDHKKNVIVAMTASAMRGDRDRAVKSGMNDYLAKPIRLEDFVEVLTKWLSPEITLEQPVVPQTTESTIDLRVLHQLREQTMKTPDVYKHLVTTFIVESSKLVEEIQQSAANNDRDSINRDAHKLKGSSSTVGAHTLAKACANLETTDDAGLSSAIENLVAELETAKNIFSKELAQ